MSFASTSISGSGEEYTMAGDLTINGITKPVELNLELDVQLVAPV